jgi:NCS1 family nucleobase:cation symporter-1
MAAFSDVRAEIERSPLANKDLAPTGREERTWTGWNFTALWIGMSVVITTYTLASGLMTAGMNWWQALLTVTLGNLLVLIPMLLNAHAGTKYGVPFPVFVRSSFGVRGANFAAMARALVACGWFGIQTWIGALALDALLTALWSGWADFGLHKAVAFAVFWLVQVAIIFRGVEGIKRLESYAAPLLLGGGVVLLVWGFNKGGGIGNVFSESARLTQGNSSFWTLFWPGLAANVGYWATLSLNIPDFTRYAKSQRSQILGQTLGLPTTMTLFSFIGIAVTAATVVVFRAPVWDPVVLITRLTADLPLLLILAMVVIVIAQISTNMAANVVSPSNDFSNLAPRQISFRTGGIITAIIGIVSFPWTLYESAGAYIFTWLVGYGSLLGTIAAVMIADYWIVRRRTLDVVELYRPDGIYRYSNGWNLKAVAAVLIGVAPAVPGFIHAATTPGGVIEDKGFFDWIYNYGIFVTFFLAGAIYLGLNALGRREPAERPEVATTAGLVE